MPLDELAQVLRHLLQTSALEVPERLASQDREEQLDLIEPTRVVGQVDGNHLGKVRRRERLLKPDLKRGAVCDPPSDTALASPPPRAASGTGRSRSSA